MRETKEFTISNYSHTISNLFDFVAGANGPWLMKN
jgi:hypothetical protein